MTKYNLFKKGTATLLALVMTTNVLSTTVFAQETNPTTILTPHTVAGVVAHDDIYVEGGKSTNLTGSEIATAASTTNKKGTLITKQSNGADQSYTRRTAMKFNLTDFNKDNKGHYYLNVETANAPKVNPGNSFTNMAIYPIDNDWTPTDLTYTILTAKLSGKSPVATLATTDKIDNTKTYKVDITKAVNDALQGDNKQLSLAFSMIDPADDNVFAIYSSGKDGVLKPTISYENDAPPALCTCDIVIGAFDNNTIVIKKGDIQATTTLAATTVLAGSCKLSGHSGQTPSIIYTVVDAGTTGATISGETLTVKTLGTARVMSTAKVNGKTKTKEASFVVTQQGNEVIAHDDTYVQGGTDADKTGAAIKSSLSEKHKHNLRIKTSDGNQTYTRMASMKFALSNFDKNAMGNYMLSVEVVAEANNNPGGDFSSMAIYAIDNKWTPADITYNNLATTIKSLQPSLTLTPAHQVGKNKIYQVDVTSVVEEALNAGKTEIALAFTMPSKAANNMFDIYGTTATKAGVVKPTIAFEPIKATVKDILVTTVIKEAPVLPSTVTIIHPDSTTSTAPATWDHINPSQYADLGSFVVNGTTTHSGQIIATKATVTVILPTAPDDHVGIPYYVSNTMGNDDNDGLTPSTPWKTLEKVNAHTSFFPNDSILLKSGDTWVGYLKPRGNGTPNNPITLSSYGGETKPIINGNGTTYSVYSGTVMLVNQEHWIIENLEVTNFGKGQAAGQSYNEPYVRAGIFVYSYDQNDIKDDVVVRNCYVHDVVSNTDVRVEAAKASGKRLVVL